MNKEDLPGYLRRILGHVDQITEIVQSMAVGTIDDQGENEAAKVNISDEAIEKLKKKSQ